jgi:hypothetical protein
MGLFFHLPSCTEVPYNNGIFVKNSKFCKNYYFRFLEGNRCAEKGKVCFLLHNLEVECLLFFLMGFPVVGADYKIMNVVLCCLSVDGSQSYLKDQTVLYP